MQASHSKVQPSLSRMQASHYGVGVIKMAPETFPFKTALNTSTLSPFELDIKQQVRIAAEAGYAGIELWFKDIDAYLASGGTIRDLRTYVRDTGIAIVNA